MIVETIVALIVLTAYTIVDQTAYKLVDLTACTFIDQEIDQIDYIFVTLIVRIQMILVDIHVEMQFDTSVAIDISIVEKHHEHLNRYRN